MFKANTKLIHLINELTWTDLLCRSTVQSSINQLASTISCVLSRAHNLIAYMYIFFTHIFVIYSFFNIYLLVWHLRVCTIRSMIAPLAHKHVVPPLGQWPYCTVWGGGVLKEGLCHQVGFGGHRCAVNFFKRNTSTV